MFQRVLWVSLTQALRSVAIVLLPIAFISLLAWATAGSSNGNTSDPIRAAMWIWLGAHHVPFSLVLPPGGEHGLLSYLPLGAMIFPLLAIRSGFIRACERINANAQEKQLTRVILTLVYAGIASLMTWGSTTTAIAPNMYLTPVLVIAISWVATISSTSSTSRARRYEISPKDISIHVVAIMVGAASLVFGIALFLNLKTVENLTTILQPGFIGGLFLLILNILYLPNAIIATLSYLGGAGFAIGSHTLISPLTHRVSEIPALPFLGGLPTGRHPLALLSIVGFVAVGALMYSVSITQSSRVIFKSYFFTTVTVGVFALLSSGSLITSAMSAVGVSPWKMPLLIASELGLGILLGMLLPRLLDAFPRSRA